MKKKIFVKIFTISLCLSAIFSTLAFAKDSKEVKQFNTNTSCAVAPHPPEAEIPD